jgi:hypothetical protein
VKEQRLEGGVIMRRRHINVAAQSRASVGEVFGLLANGASWSPIESFELERAGTTAPEGSGAIRVFRRGRTTGRDEILEVIPNRRLSYASLSGLPIRNYRGEVDLEAGETGTVIRWHSSFVPEVWGTGWLLERGIRRFLEQCARGLAEYAASPGEANARRTDQGSPLVS